MSLTFAILSFLFLAAVIAIAGTFLTKIADQLADCTGFGEALVGGILLGGVTSLSGIVTSVTAALEGYSQLAFSNAVGGIAAQTVFLAVADIFYKRANLEHASVSVLNLLQGVLLISMMGFIILVMTMPSYTFFQIHPASFLLLIIYLFGTRLVSHAKDKPTWEPSETDETVEDKPAEDYQSLKLWPLLLKFIALAAVVGFAGYFIAQTGIVIAQKSGLSESFVGALFTSVATSLPELVVSISAVRQGALTLAVSNIIGGNTFDILFLAFSDMAFRQGSLYHHVANQQLFILALSILLTSILLLGLLYRQKYGFARVGWESALMLLVFVAGYVILFFM